MDQTDETISTPEINKQNSKSEIWHYFGYNTDDKVNELTSLHLYASVAIGLNHVATGTHKIFLSISLLLILIFSEN